MTEEQAAYNRKRKEKVKGVNPKLGAFLCDNPLCQYSDQIVPKNAHIQVVSEEGTKIMKRHLHISGDGKEELYFCSVCHEAIEMTKAPEPDKKDNVRWLKPTL